MNIPANKTTLNSSAKFPDRITGIVFWGLALLGVAFSAFNIHNYESTLSYSRNGQLMEAAKIIKGWIENEPELSLVSHNQKLNHLLQQMNFKAIRITTKNDTIYSGLTADAALLDESSVEIFIDSTTEQKPRVITITALYLKDKIAIMKYRKKVLGFVGISLMIFGIILNWVLRRLLSQPFDAMFDVISNFLSGDQKARFNETRDDEFGFLARFINQGLDNLTSQKNMLEASLERERQTDSALTDEKERAEITLRSIADAVITTDRECLIEYMNPVAERLTGWTLLNAKGHAIEDILHLHDSETHRKVTLSTYDCIEKGETVQLTRSLILINKNGLHVHIENSAAPIRNNSGNVIGAVMVIQDVGHMHLLTRELSYQASHDSLTGLINRRAFENKLKNTLESLQNAPSEHVLCFFDLDQFKVVNDTCGHVAGDELLRQLSSLLLTNVREADTLGRLGGDEFGLLLTHCPMARAATIANNLLVVINNFKFIWDKRIFEIGASVGLVSITNESNDINTIMSTADMACYEAKDAGRNQIHIHTPADEEIKQRKTEMQRVTDIRDALNNDRFVLFAQPIVPLAHENKNAVHIEILLRMYDKDNNILLPAAFMTAAERYNLTIDIDKWVMERTFIKNGPALLKTFQLHKKPEYFIVAINLSGMSVTNDDFLEYTKKLLKNTVIPLSSICFEIIETAAISNLLKAKKFIETFKSMGCHFALDDFGSGMSSFAYLKNLPVDYLKIDGSYVKDIVTDPMDLALVESVNQIGQVLGMKTIAEFVEDQAIMDILMTTGIDFAQGCHVAQPAPLKDWLIEQVDLLNNVVALRPTS